MSFNIETNIENELVDIESLPPIGYDRIIAYCDTELARIKPLYDDLLQARHDLYVMADSELAPDQDVTSQLYEENSYNAQWTKSDLRMRFKGAVEFHNEPEKLDPDEADSEAYRARKEAYRQKILEAARLLGGYLAPFEPGKSPDPLDRHLGMRESTLSPETPIDTETVIIPAAAGLSNFMRIHDTLRNIESGALHTKQIIITTGERNVPAAEKTKVEAKGYRSGDTEFEAAIHAFEDMTGITMEDIPDETLAATYGVATPDTKYRKTKMTIDGSEVEVIILEAAYDRERRHEQTGRPIGRASTDETFYAALPFITKEPGPIVIESHDVWIQYQEVIANQVFGLYADKEVIATGPFKDDRVILTQAGQLDLTLAQGVVDEIGKRHDDLVKLRMHAESSKSPEIALLGRLVQAIPDMQPALERKKDYREHPIRPTPEFENEPIVNAADYGLAGQSYYSRKNALLTEGIPGVEPAIMLRESIAKTLQSINTKLDNPIISAFFGGDVELFLEEGIRERTTQTRIREVDFPEHLRQGNPSISDEEIKKIVNEHFAAPSSEDTSPAPHEAGAFDCVLRYKQEDKGYVEGSAVPLGFTDGEHGERLVADYYEHSATYDELSVQSRAFRRAFYNIMTGKAFAMDTGLIVNPTEIFHWSRHDQLAAKVAGQPAALYGAINTVQ